VCETFASGSNTPNIYFGILELKFLEFGNLGILKLWRGGVPQRLVTIGLGNRKSHTTDGMLGVRAESKVHGWALKRLVGGRLYLEDHIPLGGNGGDRFVSPSPSR